MMLIVIRAAVHLVSVSIVIVSNSNLPYEQWLAGMVVMLGGCCGCSLMLLVVGVVSGSFLFWCANMTKWSVHSCRAYKPMLFITFLTWACPIISLLTYYITMYNRYRLVYTTLHRPVATNCNQLPLRFWATTTNKKRRPPVRFSLVQFFMN